MKTSPPFPNRLPRTKSRSSWPPILRREYPTGKTAFQISVMVDGQRIRETFKTGAGAETGAGQRGVPGKNEAPPVFALPADVRAEAAKCSALLHPYQVGLTEACRYYVDHVLKYRRSPTVKEAVEKLITDATKAN